MKSTPLARAGLSLALLIVAAPRSARACGAPLPPERVTTCIAVPTRADCTEYLTEMAATPTFRWDDTEPLSFRINCEAPDSPAERVAEIQLDGEAPLTVRAPATPTRCLGQTLFVTTLRLRADARPRSLRTVSFSENGARHEFSSDRSAANYLDPVSVEVVADRCRAEPRCVRDLTPAREPMVRRWSSGSASERSRHAQEAMLAVTAPTPRGGCAGCGRGASRASRRLWGGALVAFACGWRARRRRRGA